MKKIIVVAMAFCFAVSLAFAQAGQSVTVKGDVIDNMCLEAHKTEDVAAFVKTHAKQCAVKPVCEASGYSLFVDGKVNKFDQESNAKIAEFLKKADSQLQVVVVANKNGEELSLVSIENQK